MQVLGFALVNDDVEESWRSWQIIIFNDEVEIDIQDDLDKVEDKGM